jgi:hypothetical protein
LGENAGRRGLAARYHGLLRGMTIIMNAGGGDFVYIYRRRGKLLAFGPKGVKAVPDSR